jgi:hypothetical protein
MHSRQQTRSLTQDARIDGDATCTAEMACTVSPHPAAVLVSIVSPHHTDAPHHTLSDMSFPLSLHPVCRL